MGGSVLYIFVTDGTCLSFCCIFSLLRPMALLWGLFACLFACLFVCHNELMFYVSVNKILSWVEPVQSSEDKRSRASGEV